jgi:hypothetical protein
MGDGDVFGVGPARLRAVAGKARDASEALARLGKQWDADLEALGRDPWGDDELGRGFAGGEAGFVVQRGLIDDALGAVVSALAYYADALGDTANAAERADQS